MKDLKALGQELRQVDHHLVTLLARRMILARQVEEYKRNQGQPIIRLETEEQRLIQAREWARELNLNPNFAQAILYVAIAESCRIQIDQLQTSDMEDTLPGDEERRYRKLKDNLIELTGRWAGSYNQHYETAYHATRAYLDFERQVIEAEISALDHRSLAIDLGCATGRVAFSLAHNFDKVIGYDLSPAMIECARVKITATAARNVEFICADLEEEIPQPDDSTSLAVMNLGTGSDMRNLPAVVSSIRRVLKPAGRFVVSFYNCHALIYRCYLPWPLPLAAEVNSGKRCLDVHCGDKIFSVYARPYTVQEVGKLIGAVEGLKVSSVKTHPTIGSILPNDILGAPEVYQSINEIDQLLSTQTDGAYILATGWKVP